MKDEIYDVAILGAGAAGLFCAAELSRSSKKIILLEGNKGVGKKILISGGGRCNFTNRNHTVQNLHGENEHFAKSANSQYAANDFIQLVDSHKIEHYEKTLGQLFCVNSAKEIIQMLQKEIQGHNVRLEKSAKVENVTFDNNVYQIMTNFGVTKARNVVVATGGPSLPSLGATKVGHRIAQSFGHKLTDMAPALVPLTLNQHHEKLDKLSGVSLDVEARGQHGPVFRESLLFTHKGLSGPVILQVSSYWRPEENIEVNLLPNENVEGLLNNAKNRTPKKQVKTVLGQFLPKRFLEVWPSQQGLDTEQKISELSQKNIEKWHKSLHQWQVTPSGTEGPRKAEVTRGGVSTQDISSKTMESKLSKGLYFIGEVLDVTGHLGGHNFQWAWASAYSCARALENKD
jgi:predicted Rossmann fold flavoprotein